MGKERLEAFSDGVLAIAITLLVLDLHVPEPGGDRSLGRELVHQWPSYVAYIVSFLVIGVIWINHHATLRRVRIVDHALLIQNLALLLTVCTIPFTTSLLATYLNRGQGAELAAVIYCASMLVLTLVFYGMQHHILFHPGDLTEGTIDADAKREIDRRSRAGAVPYVLATAIAVLSPPAALALCAGAACYYALPPSFAAPAQFRVRGRHDVRPVRRRSAPPRGRLH